MDTFQWTRRDWLRMAGTLGLAVGGLTTRPCVVKAASEAGQAAIDLGKRRELFVDHHLIDRLQGAQLRLHAPQPREFVLKFDAPWEGLYSGYETVLEDNKALRFYYRGLPEPRHSLDTLTPARPR